MVDWFNRLTPTSWLFARFRSPNRGLAEDARLSIQKQRADFSSNDIESRVEERTKELTAREAQLRLITDSLPVRVSYVDQNQIYRFNNQAYEYWSGLNLREITGHPLREHLPSEVYEKSRPYIERALAGERVIYEGRSIHPELGLRYWSATYIPDRGENGEVRGFVALIHDITEQKLANERERFLHHVSDTLSSSLDVSATYSAITALAVPEFADWCFLDVLDERGVMRRVSISTSETSKLDLVEGLKRYPISADIMTLLTRVLLSAQTMFVPEVTPEFLRASSQSKEHEDMMKALDPRSAIVIPLKVRGRILGAFTLVRSGPGRIYSEDERKTAEEMARRAALAVDNSLLYQNAEYERRRLKTVFDQAPALLMILRGPDLAPEYTTPMAQRLFGRRLIPGRPLRDLVPELADQGFIDLMLDVVQSEKPFFGQEIPMRVAASADEPPKEGYYDFVYQPMREASGEIDGLMILGIDVTERVLARRALAQSEDRLRLAIEAMELGTFDYFPATGQLIWSDRLKELFGLLHGSSVDYETFIAAVHPDDRERMISLLTRLLSGDDGSEKSVEFRAIGVRDKRERWLLGRGKVYFNEVGKAVRFVGTILDITQRRRAEEDLRSAVRSRDEFLSMASHELKTPLTSLKLQTQLIKRSLSVRGETFALAPERMKKMIDQTDRQVDRLSRLVDDMLDISRISTGTLALHPEKADLAEIATEVAERLRPLLTEAGCDLTIEAEAGLYGDWDRFRLEQVFTNLLTNAARYGAGRPVQVIVRSGARGAEVSVHDHGRGIAPEDQERIFHRFERAISSNEVSGLGLGLFIARQIVEKHGGTIRVESRPGQGSVFVVALPIVSIEKLESQESLA